jgi:hypothetical protein
MKILSFVFTFILLGFSISVPQIALAAQCSPASDAATEIAANGGGWGSCEGGTPDELEVSFYKLALCTSKPTLTDDSSCTYILDTGTPITGQIAIGRKLPLLNGEISIPEGTYTHALMVIDTTIGIKSIIEFASGNTQKDGLGNSGNLCWTNGEDIVWGYPNVNDMPITCGTTPSPEFSYETFKAFGCDAPCSVTNTILNESTTTTKYDVYLLSDLTTLATVGRDGNGYPIGNANYMWGVQSFNTPPTISPTTRNIEMGFKLTEGMDINFNDWSCGHACVEGVNLTSFQFTLSTN